MTSIRVSWRKPDDEGASSITDYLVYYMPSGRGKESVTSELSFVIEDLLPDTEYVIWVVARNDEGSSDNYSRYIVFTLAPSKSLLIDDIQFLYLGFYIEIT